MQGVMDQAREIANAKDTAALVEFLSDDVDAVVALDAFHALANEIYWERKNLGKAMEIARAGVTFGLVLASQTDSGYEFRSAAKAMAFNLASFAWPGWDEEGITIERQHKLAALDAARTNVRLAVELNKGHIAVSRGHWLVGAILLALDRYQEAIAEFLASRLSADEGQSDVESAMAEGYAALVRVVERPGDEAIEDELRESLERLRSMDEGPQYADQIEKAQTIFAARP